MADRAFVEEKNDLLTDHLDDRKMLGFNMLELKQKFLIATAIGIDHPKDQLEKKKGWILFKTFGGVDNALMAAAYLGQHGLSDEFINFHANQDDYIAFCEKCASSGFDKLKTMAENEPDNDLLVSEKMYELDDLYKKNVIDVDDK
jgi:hypothetical protein